MTLNGASFKFKLFFIFTVLSFFTSCAFIAFHAFDKVAETRRHAARELQLRARQLADSVRIPLYAEDRDVLRDLAQKAGMVPGTRKVVITAVNGSELAEFRPYNLPAAEETITGTAEVVNAADEISGLEEGQNPPAVKIGKVYIESGTSDLNGAIRRDVGFSCLLAFFSWVTVSGLSFLVLRRMTRSFETLVRGVEAMKGGDYTSRIPIVCTDEPGRVALAINALAETLQQRDKENRILTQDLIDSIETEVRAREELADMNRTLAQENQERIQAEQAARKNEQTLQTLMDIMPVGVMLVEQDGTVQYVNHFLVECFGYCGDEIPTLEAWFTLAFPDPAYREQKMQEQREALLQSSNPEIIEVKPCAARVTCKGGNVRHVLFSNQAQGDRTIVAVIDITDRELMQEQLNKVQKLESLGVLAGGIAHNFNNALTGVMGFISLSRCLIEQGHGAHKYLQLAEKASLRAAGMARQLLTFAKGGAPVKKSVHLGKLVEEVVSLTLNGSNVRCVVELPPSLPPVKADEGQIVQALSNIVINAMQAMPGGGVITIRAEADPRSCQDPTHADSVSYVCLSIADEGHGIGEGDLPKIFDPYFSTKETTGLGLASVHSIIYRHGGHVSVSSTVGKGTTFTICLPSERAAAFAYRDAADGGAPAAPSGGSVLVMDDDANIRELSTKLLGFLGYRSVACADGKEAVALYRARREAGEPFLAAILDLTVPGGMGGVEAAREILADHPKANLIVSSGYSYDPVMAQYKRYGFCGAVAKPYRAGELGHELSLLQP